MQNIMLGIIIGGVVGAGLAIMIFVRSPFRP